MVLTLEERAEVSRKNGAKSRGVKTEAGKQISRRNALKHGVYARTLSLDDEDETEVQALHDAYHESMNPQNPAEAFLVDECFHADVSTQRYRRAEKVLLDQQASRALEARLAQRQGHLEQ